MFERVFVVNLRRRTDRWQRFLESIPADWPFAKPERFEAIDGENVPCPDWWNGGSGAWGCYRSHLAALESCLNEGVESALVLEDDAHFLPEFSKRAMRFSSHLPDDWALVYLGGQHIESIKGTPFPVNEHVYRPFNVNRNHAYGYRGREMMTKLYNHLTDVSNWTALHHVDHHLGEFHKQMHPGIYVPDRWLVGQREGLSNINGSELPEREFKSSKQIIYPTIALPMVAVLGSYSGGTSCISGLLHHLGVNMGENLNAKDQTNWQGHFEAAGLRAVCCAAYTEPWLVPSMKIDDRQVRLRQWAVQRCESIDSANPLVGGKHPILCMLGRDLEIAWNCPRYVVVDRPLEDCKASLLRRDWGWAENSCDRLVDTLIAHRETFLAGLEDRVCRLDFYATRENPAEAVDRLIEFLDLKPTLSQKDKAIAFVLNQSAPGTKDG
ncbi:MAG: glycosyltransferase family 25 protein [Rubripirellula sp.]